MYSEWCRTEMLLKYWLQRSYKLKIMDVSPSRSEFGLQRSGTAIQHRSDEMCTNRMKEWKDEALWIFSPWAVMIRSNILFFKKKIKTRMILFFWMFAFVPFNDLELAKTFHTTKSPFLLSKTLKCANTWTVEASCKTKPLSGRSVQNSDSSTVVVSVVCFLMEMETKKFSGTPVIAWLSFTQWNDPSKERDCGFKLDLVSWWATKLGCPCCICLLPGGDARFA